MPKLDATIKQYAWSPKGGGGSRTFATLKSLNRKIKNVLRRKGGKIVWYSGC